MQAFSLPTKSMEDTLLAGDRLLVQRFPKPAAVRGEIVAFVYPIDRRETFVKRIVGIPGDRVRISNKILYCNGAALNEPYAIHETDYVDGYRDNFPSEPVSPLPDAAREMLTKHVVNGEVVVPDGSYFVLGDNRDYSLDSRYWGFVGAGDLIGRPILIYDSEDQPTGALLSGAPSWPPRVRWGRLFKRL